MEFLPFYFCLSLVLGFLIVYVQFPKPKVVIKTPHPSNAGNVTYIDDNNVCYRYKKEEITCKSTLACSA